MAVRLAGGKRQLSRKARLLLLTGKLMHAGQPASPVVKTSHSPVLSNQLVSCITSGFTSRLGCEDCQRLQLHNTATCFLPPPFHCELRLGCHTCVHVSLSQRVHALFSRHAQGTM